MDGVGRALIYLKDRSTLTWVARAQIIDQPESWGELGAAMRKVLEYRQNADECRKLAAEAATERARQELQEVATEWERLADARLELVKAYPNQGIEA